jgi:hypothetical protein
MEPLRPVYTADLFRPLLRELIPLLRELDAEDWLRLTVAKPWRVRDIAAHLLDNDLRKLSAQRDGHRQPSTKRISSYPELVEYINSNNAGAVDYAARLSPRVLVDLLEITGEWVAELFASLPPHEVSGIGVAWAGEERSENWMDVGREYTERWHHQMQIRDATCAPGLVEGRWFAPVLSLSIRAFPRAYAGVTAPTGTKVVFEVLGDAGGVWSVVREPDGWRVLQGAAPAPDATVRADADDAWRLLFNALNLVEARDRLTILGDPSMAEPILRARSVMV